MAAGYSYEGKPLRFLASLLICRCAIWCIYDEIPMVVAYWGLMHLIAG